MYGCRCEEGMEKGNGMCKICEEVSMQEEKRGFPENSRRLMRLTAVVVAGKRERESRWTSRFVSARRPNSNYSRDRIQNVTKTRYGSFSRDTHPIETVASVTYTNRSPLVLFLYIHVFKRNVSFYCS